MTTVEGNLAVAGGTATGAQGDKEVLMVMSSYNAGKSRNI